MSSLTNISGSLSLTLPKYKPHKPQRIPKRSIVINIPISPSRTPKRACSISEAHSGNSFSAIQQHVLSRLVYHFQPHSIFQASITQCSGISAIHGPCSELASSSSVGSGSSNAATSRPEARKMRKYHDSGRW